MNQLKYLHRFFARGNQNLTPSYRTPLSLLRRAVASRKGRRGEGGEVHSRESGFTIMESLVAMVVAAVLLSAIAPAIVLSTATRVQSRRVELATLAARTYLDGVKTGVIDSANIAVIDPDAGETLGTYPVPAIGTLTCNVNEYCSVPTTNLYCIDGDDSGGCTTDSTKDFVIQAFRTAGTVADGYELAIRVYRADGFSADGGDLIAPDKQGIVTSGLGDRKAPMLEMTTAITSESDSFNDLCNRLKDDTKAATNSTCG